MTHFKNKNSISRQEGFSLLEVLLGAAILAVCSAIAVQNFAQNAQLRKHDLAQSMLGRELDPLLRLYVDQTLVGTLRDNFCQLKTKDLRYKDSSQSSIIIIPWTNAPAAITKSVDGKCKAALSFSGPNADKFSGCIKVGNLRSLPPLSGTSKKSPNLFAYVQFDVNFKRMTYNVGGHGADLTCIQFLNKAIASSLDFSYTTYWMDQSKFKSEDAAMVKYTNTLNVNNQ